MRLGRYAAELNVWVAIINGKAMYSYSKKNK